MNKVCNHRLNLYQTMVFTIKLNEEDNNNNNNSNIREYYNERLPNSYANIYTKICNDNHLSKIRYHK